MAFWTYILHCAEGRYYTGHTDDLESRIGEDQTDRFFDFTSRRLLASVIWPQEFGTRDEAPNAEIIVKKWSRAKKEALITGNWVSLSFFAKPPSERVSTALDTNGTVLNCFARAGSEYRASGRGSR